MQRAKSFDPTEQVLKRNQRQKSDVAQKLVAMCLHALSARMVEGSPGLRVESQKYRERLRAVFGNGCAFCQGELERGATHVEHLQPMNRARGGLHVAGNVVLSCRN